MFKKFFLAVALMLFAAGNIAGAACTAEEVQAKTQDFSNAAMAMAQKDPQKYQQYAQEMQAQLLEVQKTQDVEAVCRFYDEWIEKMK